MELHANERTFTVTISEYELFHLLDAVHHSYKERHEILGEDDDHIAVLIAMNNKMSHALGYESYYIMQ